MHGKSRDSFEFNLPKSLITIFVVLALAIYVTGTIVTLYLRHDAVINMQNDNIEQATAFENQLNAELDRICTQMKYVLTRSTTLRLNLGTKQNGFATLYPTIQKVTEEVYTLQNTSNLIECTALYFPGLEKCVDSEGTYNSLSEDESSLVSDYLLVAGHSALMTVNGKLYLVADAANFNDKTATAIIWAELSRTELEGWCRQYAYDGASCMLLFDGGDGKSVAINSWDDSITNEILDKLGGMDLDASEWVDYLDNELIRVYDPVGNWELWVVLYAGEDTVKQITAPFAVWLAVPTLVVALSVVIFLYLVWRMVARPLNRISDTLKQFELTGLQITDTKANTSMDFLYDAFVALGNQLQDSLEQAYNSKLLACQSEIKYLQAQISPHFLYNSFYHLYRMAKMEDNEGVAEMSLKLSSYYRYITRSAESVVPLIMEYNNIVDYTEIQTIRFGDRILVQLDQLPEEYKDLPTPRFVLQPLFENAYHHGVEKMEDGIIRLRFIKRDGYLDVWVENNGSCKDVELERLNRYLTSQDSEAEITALKNVRTRMQLIGGTLTVNHGSLGGFGVCLSLPIESWKEIEENTDVGVTCCG